MGSALVCVELGVGPKFEPNKFGGVGKKQSAFLLSLVSSSAPRFAPLAHGCRPPLVIFPETVQAGPVDSGLPFLERRRDSFRDGKPPEISLFIYYTTILVRLVSSTLMTDHQRDHRSLLRSLARRALAERTFVRPLDAPAPMGEDAQLLEMDLHRAGRQELGVSDEAAPVHRAALRRVLRCWCAARPHIGYVQGINCIAAALLVMCRQLLKAVSSGGLLGRPPGADSPGSWLCCALVLSRPAAEAPLRTIGAALGPGRRRFDLAVQVRAQRERGGRAAAAAGRAAAFRLVPRPAQGRASRVRHAASALPSPPPPALLGRCHLAGRCHLTAAPRAQCGGRGVAAQPVGGRAAPRLPGAGMAPAAERGLSRRSAAALQPAHRPGAAAAVRGRAGRVAGGARRRCLW